MAVCTSGWRNYKRRGDNDVYELLDWEERSLPRYRGQARPKTAPLADTRVISHLRHHPYPGATGIPAVRFRSSGDTKTEASNYARRLHTEQRRPPSPPWPAFLRAR